MLSPAHSEILMELIRMEKRGELDRASFDDIPIQVYHHPDCPGVSSTTIKTILKKSWNHIGTDGGAEKDSFRFGNAFHCLNNEPHLFATTYYVCPFNSRKGDDWKIHRDKADGRTILMQREFDCLKVMTKKLWLHPEAAELLVGAQYEVTFFSRDVETDVLKKCRVDAIKNKVLSDLKTTWDASHESFQRDCRKFLYRISAAYYLEIAGEFYGELLTDFKLIPCEKEHPHELTTYPVSAESLAVASEEIRIALRKIAAIKKDPQAWRGYELGLNQKLFI